MHSSCLDDFLGCIVLHSYQLELASDPKGLLAALVDILCLDLIWAFA